MKISTIPIESLGPKGDGIHQGEHKRIYVERALPGDSIKARIYRDADGIYRGEILELVAPSPLRRNAPCSHYDRCGNCTLQHLSSDYYQQWKVEMVKATLAKWRVEPEKWKKPLFLNGTRRRLTLTARKHRGSVMMGYYRRRSQEIFDLKNCAVAHPELLALIAPLRAFLNPHLPPRAIVDIFIQVVNGRADMLVTGPIGKLSKPDKAFSAGCRGFLDNSIVSRISWRATPADRIVPLVEKSPVIATFGDLQVALPAGAFLQPTREGEQALVQEVVSELPPGGKFADLFAGCGTFSGALLGRGSVDSYEMTPSAVIALAKAGKHKPLRVFRRDLFHRPLRREELKHYDAVVFDPPRAGCPEQSIAMASSRTPLLIGVSCNPATFARDAHLLSKGGYHLKSITVVDQFVWSHHVEMIGVFVKRRIPRKVKK